MNSCKRHQWKNVGGCKENPGIMGIGGAAIRHSQECTKCGASRSRVFGDVNQCGNLRSTNLRSADLSGADLSGADLRSADLSGADLSGANLRSADLSESQGIKYSMAAFAGHGERGRMVSLVEVEGQPVFFCGCFKGSPDELAAYIAAGEDKYKSSRTLAMSFCLEAFKLDTVKIW